jgi:hypothetical protein
MQRERSSIWLQDLNETASGKPGTFQHAFYVDDSLRLLAVPMARSGETEK